MIMLAAILMAPAVLAAGLLEDLPLLDPDVATYMVSSHNKRGLNGDGGWYLHDGEIEREGISGWADIDAGATGEYTTERVHEGKGAIVHTVRLAGRESGWRSIRKSLSEGFNLEGCDRLSLWVWPTHADGGIDYAVRIDSGDSATQVDIRDLAPGRWNHVVLDISRVPRKGVGAFWLLFQLSWGAADGMRFYVDDIEFLAPGGKPFPVDDFEGGIRRAVLFDARGPGAVRAIWGLGGDDIRIEVDGRTAIDAPQDDFFEGRVPGFPAPLVRKDLVASGPWKCVSHWSFAPIGFLERCRITTRNPSPFYHVIAERFREASRASPWSPGAGQASLIAAWRDPGQDPKAWAGLRTVEGEVEAAPGGAAEIASIDGAGAIAAIRLRLPEAAREGLDTLWLRMDWDGGTKDIEGPVGFFFGAGVRWRDIPSHAIGIHGDEGYCFLPMPFWKSARIRIENRGPAPVGRIGYSVAWRPEPYPEGRTGRLRTSFRSGSTTRGRDWIFFEAAGEGQFVGVVHRLIGGHYCEGDIRFHIDGSRSPAFYGTGTEDYYHQACWPNRDNHTPFHGCVGDVTADAAKVPGKTFYDFPASYYRFHLEAPVRFRSSIRCGIEHGGTNDTDSQYSSLAFAYVRDRVGLAQTDAIAFSGPGVEEIENCFEGDDDDVLVQCAILKTKEPVERVLKIDPANTGVRLRRVLDQACGPQRAEVSVDGAPAWTWYDPDRNPWKRLAESDLELPPALVRGKSSIKVVFQPGGGPWTIGELRALSHVERPVPARSSMPSF
jgi:D-arabinan exo alpha-(1,3)/(1,5)-arabinofuranosidase (non-reducing end)